MIEALNFSGPQTRTLLASGKHTCMRASVYAELLEICTNGKHTCMRASVYAELLEICTEICTKRMQVDFQKLWSLLEICTNDNGHGRPSTAGTALLASPRTLPAHSSSPSRSKVPPSRPCVRPPLQVPGLHAESDGEAFAKRAAPSLRGATGLHRALAAGHDTGDRPGGPAWGGERNAAHVMLFDKHIASIEAGACWCVCV